MSLIGLDLSGLDLLTESVDIACAVVRFRDKIVKAKVGIQSGKIRYGNSVLMQRLLVLTA